MSDVRRQELDCTECGGIFRFDLDFDQDGNHMIRCPACDHVHYRVIVDGRITEERFDPNPSYNTLIAQNYYYQGTSSASVDTGYTNSGAISAGTGYSFLRDSWLNSTTTY